MSLAWALASLSAWPFPPVTWGYAVRVFFFVGGDPAHQRAPDTMGLQRIAVPGPGVGVPGGWADPAAVPDAFRFVHDALAVGNDFQVPPENLQGNEDGVELSSVHSLDWAGQGSGSRVRLVVPCPVGAGRLPKVRVPGAHRRGVGVDEVLPRELALLWLAAILFRRGSRGAVVGGSMSPHSHRHLGCQSEASPRRAGFLPSGLLRTSHFGHTHQWCSGVSLVSWHSGQHGSMSKPALE